MKGCCSALTFCDFRPVHVHLPKNVQVSSNLQNKDTALLNMSETQANQFSIPSCCKIPAGCVITRECIICFLRVKIYYANFYTHYIFNVDLIYFIFNTFFCSGQMTVIQVRNGSLIGNRQFEMKIWWSKWQHQKCSRWILRTNHVLLAPGGFLSWCESHWKPYKNKQVQKKCSHSHL